MTSLRTDDTPEQTIPTAQHIDMPEIRHLTDRTPLLVGRDRECALLRARLDATFDGHGGLVLIGDVAGSGKTALVGALGDAAAARGALVLTDRCHGLTASPPYAPWIALLAGISAAANLPRPLVLSAIGAANQGDFFAQVGAFFAAVAAQRPLVGVRRATDLKVGLGRSVC